MFPSGEYSMCSQARRITKVLLVERYPVEELGGLFDNTSLFTFFKNSRLSEHA